MSTKPLLLCIDEQGTSSGIASQRDSFHREQTAAAGLGRGAPIALRRKCCVAILGGTATKARAAEAR